MAKKRVEYAIMLDGDELATLTGALKFLDKFLEESGDGVLKKLLTKFQKAYERAWAERNRGER